MCAEFCASLLAAGVQVVVAVAILMLYIILQAFAIPGTAYLSLIVGALYGPTQGLVMVALISTLGSSACYAMSALFGAPIAHALWRDKLDDFRGKVTDRSNDLLSYIIFLRVTPILPNTFINVASPIVGVPFRPFFIGRHLHLDPPTLLLHGHADTMLHTRQRVLTYPSLACRNVAAAGHCYWLLDLLTEPQPKHTSLVAHGAAYFKQAVTCAGCTAACRHLAGLPAQQPDGHTCRFPLE